MPTKLVVVRNERSTYEVHVETDSAHVDQQYPSGKFIGGQSLDLTRLNAELEQHGCSQEAINKALQGVESTGTACIVI